MTASRAVTLDEAWAEAEAECARLPLVAGLVQWPKLQGPFPLIGQERTYQATVTNAHGTHADDDPIGVESTPAAALHALAMARRTREGEAG